jgi:hypothetical protein
MSEEPSGMIDGSGWIVAHPRYGPTPVLLAWPVVSNSSGEVLVMEYGYLRWWDLNESGLAFGADDGEVWTYATAREMLPKGE